MKRNLVVFLYGRSDRVERVVDECARAFNLPSITLRHVDAADAFNASSRPGLEVRGVFIAPSTKLAERDLKAMEGDSQPALIVVGRSARKDGGAYARDSRLSPLSDIAGEVLEPMDGVRLFKNRVGLVIPLTYPCFAETLATVWFPGPRRRPTRQGSVKAR
jgi:hypothetical protein